MPASYSGGETRTARSSSGAAAAAGILWPIRRLALCCLALLALLTITFAAANPAQALVASKDFNNGEVVVKLSGGVAIDEINADYGSVTVEKLLGSAGIYLLKLPASADTQAVAARMETDPRLIYAEPNFVAESPEGDGRFRAFGLSETKPDYEQYAASSLGLSCARKVSRGAGTTVAVLDTGAQLDHPDLQPNFQGVARYDFVDDDTDPSDHPVGLDSNGNGVADELSGHGTHVAGIVEFVAPDAKIMPLRVLDTEGFGNVFVIAEAISFAGRNGADVINMSFGTAGRSDLLQDVIKQVSESGAVVVAAAGNSSADTPHYPAAGDDVIATTSVDRFNKKSGFANYGPWVDVAAPGDGIRSTFPTSTNAYWSGTSMAAPFVAGQAALIHSVNPLLTAAGVRGVISSTARPLDANNPDYSGMLGAGSADIGASMRQLRPSTVCG
ncbi:MAG TPA: S8 family serine peptidase [Rubrobacteraceae bacterium]|nr:S8 family serine peptidase [Rubrobacteraceae bacterium]